MKTLKTLIRLHQKQLDDLLKKINNLEEQKNNLSKTLQYLENQVTKELEEYCGGRYAFMLEKYLKNMENKKKQLIEHIENTDRQIQSLRSELHDKFAELKKFEIALQNHLKREQNLLKVAETKFLDEFNTNQFNLNSVGKN